MRTNPMTGEDQLTYEDFEIGQMVMCTNLDGDGKNNADFWNQHLTIGKMYKVDDTDFHFWESIAVRSDNKKITLFVPCAFFKQDLKAIRKEKLKRINKISKKS